MNGKEFKQRRIAIGFKKRPQVARSIGCSFETVKAWEIGRNPVAKYAINWLLLREACLGKKSKN